jgi:hypothetical protein
MSEKRSLGLLIKRGMQTQPGGVYDTNRVSQGLGAIGVLSRRGAFYKPQLPEVIRRPL